MTRVDDTPSTGSGLGSRTGTPARFGSILVVVTVALLAGLYLVPQEVFTPISVLAVAVVVLGGGAAVGAAAAAVLASTSGRSRALSARGSGVYFLASGLCFFTLCIAAPAAVIIGANGVYGAFHDAEPRAVLLAAVVGGVLLLGAVAAVAGAVLCGLRDVRARLEWAKVDLAVQVFSLGAILAAIAILY